MSTSRPARRDPGYAGLTTPVETLPSCWYFDAAHHARELRQIWYRNWVYVCRSSELGTARSFRTYSLGEQSVFVVRGDDGTVRAFYNTCRHRGAALCRGDAGRFPAAGIVCPYHAWRYSVSGELVQASSALAGDGFDVRDFPLYALPVTDWNGFVFVALTPDPAPFAASVDLPLNRVDAWDLPRLVLGHRLTQDHRVQLEGVLGELQRVPALPRCTPAPVAAGADLWAGAARAPRRSALAGPRRRGRSQVRRRAAPRRRVMVDGRPPGGCAVSQPHRRGSQPRPFVRDLASLHVLRGTRRLRARRAPSPAGAGAHRAAPSSSCSCPKRLPRAAATCRAPSSSPTAS